MTANELDSFRSRLREVVKIGDLLESIGHHVRRNANGNGTALCPFHDDSRPSLSIYTDPKDGIEKFRCYSCGQRGDCFEFAKLQGGDPDHLSTLRRLAEKHQIPWPEALQNGPVRSNVIDRTTRAYEREMTQPVLEYLAGRGFPEAFVKERRIGYVPVGTAATRTRIADLATKYNVLKDAVGAGLVLETKGGKVDRDFFWSETRGYIIFPNLVDGKAIGLQGRAFPATSATKSKYLNLPGSSRQLYNLRDAAFPSVLLCEGIPDTMSAMLAKIPNTGACGIFGTQGWNDDWLTLFRRARRIYVALDRDAVPRAIDLARVFGTRGRVLILPDILGPKGDLNDWLVRPAERDPDQFRALLQDAMEASLTPYALLADRIPADIARWDLEHVVLLSSAQRHSGNDYTGLDLLRDLGHQAPIFRDSHLLRVGERIGLPFPTLQEAALDLARESGTGGTP